jgi:UDP-N-acetylmuramyl pentapeptide synthase
MRRSLAAAAQTAKLRGEPLFLTVGEMGELGPEAERSHAALGKHIAQCAPGWVIWRGGQAEPVERSLRKAGFTGNFAVAASVEDFGGLLRRFGAPAGVYLFKGSRSNMLEQFVDAFQKTAHGKGGMHAL